MNINIIGVGLLGDQVVRSCMDTSSEEDEEYVPKRLRLRSLPYDEWRFNSGKNFWKKIGSWKPSMGRSVAEEFLTEDKFGLGQRGAYLLEDDGGEAASALIVVGLGGGTGTGAAPALAEFARTHDRLTVAVVTTPFRFEGRRRTKWAEDAVAELERAADMVVVVPNESLFALTDQLVTVEEAFLLAMHTLTGITRSVAEIMEYRPPRNSRRRKSPVGKLGLPDRMEAESLLRARGRAWAANGYGRGQSAAQDAVAAAVRNPLLDPVENASTAVLSLAHGPDIEQDDLSAACQIARDSIDLSINLELAQVPRDDMADEVRAGLLIIGPKPDPAEEVDNPSTDD